MSTKAGRWAFAVLRQVGELDSVIGEHGMDAVWDRFDKGLEEGSGGLHAGLFYKLNRDELGGAIDGDQEVKLAFRGTYFGQVDTEEADRIPVEFRCLPPSTSGSRLMPCRSRQRCSEERLILGMVAWSA